MSGLFKAIGKVFKAVVKVVKVVAPIVLAAAAVVFTAGAALGLTATWGAVAASVGTSIAGAGTVGTMLAGAITYAGYGAAAGGLMAAVSGKPIMKGLQQGAAVGAVTGGVMGAAGLYKLPVDVAARSSSLAANSAIPTPTATETLAQGAAAPGAAGAAAGTGAATGAAGAAGGAPGMMQGVSNAELLKALKPSTSFFNTNAGAGLIAGVGTGLLQGSDAKAGQEAAAAQAARVSGNYQTGSTAPAPLGSTNAGTVQTSVDRGFHAPSDTFAFSPSGKPGQWQFRPDLGRIVWIDNAPGMTFQSSPNLMA